MSRAMEHGTWYLEVMRGHARQGRATDGTAPVYKDHRTVPRLQPAVNTRLTRLTRDSWSCPLHDLDTVNACNINMSAVRAVRARLSPAYILSSVGRAGNLKFRRWFLPVSGQNRTLSITRNHLEIDTRLTPVLGFLPGLTLLTRRKLAGACTGSARARYAP
jgi:hypothetical protein